MLRGSRERRVGRHPFRGLPDGLIRHECSGRIRLEIEPDTLDISAVERATGITVTPATRHAAAAVLWPDGESPYDSLAIGIWLEGIQVGWLTHADSASVSTVVRILAEADVVLECGAMLEAIQAADGRTRLGGWVAFDPALARAALDARTHRGVAVTHGRFVSPT